MLLALLLAVPVTLAWKPMAESILTYDWERSGLYGAIDADIKMTLTRQVLDGSTLDAIHLKETLVLVEQRVGFQVQPFDKDHPQTESWKLVRKGDGTFLSYDSPKEPHWPDETLLADPLIDFVYPSNPVSRGEGWTSHTTDATSDRTSDFTYVGVERVGRWKCNKVTVALHARLSNGEDGGMMTGSGTFWLDPSDGAIVKSDLAINEYQPAPVKLHEIITRKA